MRTRYSADASMDVAREAASASISMPVKAVWNSTSTASIETGVLEGLGVGCRSWARPVDFGDSLSRGHADPESQSSTAGSEGDRESRLTLDILLRLSKSSLQCDSLDFFFGGSE